MSSKVFSFSANNQNDIEAVELLRSTCKRTGRSFSHAILSLVKDNLPKEIEKPKPKPKAIAKGRGKANEAK